jgi:hypothetical protein
MSVYEYRIGVGRRTNLRTHKTAHRQGTHAANMFNTFHRVYFALIAAAAVAFYVVRKRTTSERTRPVYVDGDCTPEFERVRQAFRCVCTFGGMYTQDSGKTLPTAGKRKVPL